jgi:hypothetical protein
MAYPGGGEAESAGAIARARDRHERSLMAIEGVLGVALGMTRIGDDALIVYARDESVRRRVPSEVDGFPVEVQVTGEIDAYTGPGP